MARRMTRHLLVDTGAGASVRHQRNAIPAHFGFIGGAPHIWVIEEEGQATRRYTYQILYTDAVIPDGLQYVATARHEPAGITAHLYR